MIKFAQDDGHKTKCKKKMQQKFLCENYLQQDLHKKSTVFLYFSYTVKQKKKICSIKKNKQKIPNFLTNLVLFKNKKYFLPL